MSVEGTFPMGAFIFAKMITGGMNPVMSTMLAFFIGTLAGLITYALNIKLKITALLSGILTMTLFIFRKLKIKWQIKCRAFSTIHPYLTTWKY